MSFVWVEIHAASFCPLFVALRFAMPLIQVGDSWGSQASGRPFLICLSLALLKMAAASTGCWRRTKLTYVLTRSCLNRFRRLAMGRNFANIVSKPDSYGGETLPCIKHYELGKQFSWS